MKNFLLIFIIFATFSTTKAQTRFGIKAGGNLSTFTGKSYTDVSLKTGFQIGAIAEIKASEKIFVQLELLYSEQGAKIDTSQNIEQGFVIIDYDEKWIVNYLAIPVMVKYYVAKKLNVEAGPQVSILLNAKERYKTSATSPELFGETIRKSGTDDISSQFKSIDIAVNAGFGYDFTDHIFANVRYNYGLINAYDFQFNNEKNSYSRKMVGKNNVVAFSVGYKF